ncbi:hypothetical protein [Dyella amyloliquefaciens]|uniref:hypothetical protein n=1 Tax=Dyella amyloliquefaciens TaxID=1770545 RepID=UPI00102EA545|nr:hypothetical protein [Dyella amyloliquefaciens]
MTSLMGWLVISALMYAAGWLQRNASASRKERALLRKFVALTTEREQLESDNRFLEEWCNRFRELYLSSVTSVDPEYGAKLRDRWAHVQARPNTWRLLRRARRG